MSSTRQTLTCALACLTFTTACAAQENVSRGTRYFVQTANRLTVSLPIGEVAGEHLYRSASGKWLELPGAKYNEGVLTFTLAPEQLGQGSTVLLIGKPKWLDLDDNAPPKITKALVDGKSIASSGPVSLGWLDEAPKRLELEIADDRNPLDASSVRAIVNGEAVAADDRCVRFETDAKDQKKGRIACSIPALVKARTGGTTRIVVECDDFAPDREKCVLELAFTITQPPKIKLGEPAATAPNGIKIFVDSLFRGYENAECMVDGKFQLPGTSTVGCSWASVESEDDHWACFVLPKKQKLSGLKISWPNWKNTYWTSRRYDIMTWDGKEWRRALRVQKNPAGKSSTHTFTPCTTDRVLIWQPSLGGHAGYKDIFWVTEVEFLP